MAVVFTCLDFDLDSEVFTIWIYLHIIASKTADLNAINKGSVLESLALPSSPLQTKTASEITG